KSRTLISRSILLALAVSFAAACGRGDGYALSEEDEPSFRKGESLMKENRMDEALLAFEKVSDARRDCPESHLELGRIYMDHVKDPIAAIYHFRKYLELRPDSETARQVTQLIESAKKDFARTLPGDPFGTVSGSGQTDLAAEIRRLRAENAELRRSLTASGQHPLPAAASAPTAQPSQPAPANQPPAQRQASAHSYTVQTGDTLSKISDAVYGTTNRWQEIFNANKSQLKSPHDLKVGMVLVIP
ncbi:MAG TPA: LysM peptidoglycan-binding domain-containing protein, partial [Opitutales bacterium]|nr:LysM peptidoglycan-binding domain-containing protein [Opitutales bacterium]